MRTFGKFKLSTPGYESKEEEEEESSSSVIPIADDKTITENILFKEFNQKPDDFEVFEDNGKLKVNCKPCDLELQSAARNVLTKHYTSQRHENALKGKSDKKHLAIAVLNEIDQDESVIIFGKDDSWGCALCDETDSRRKIGTNAYLVRKHYTDVHPIQVPPKKSPDLPVLKLPVKIKKSTC
jgi:hypothetical protein